MTVSHRPPDDQRRVISFRSRTGNEPWVTTKKLAEHLDVSERTIQRWTAEGMPCLRSRRTLRYQVSACLAWLREIEA